MMYPQTVPFPGKTSSIHWWSARFLGDRQVTSPEAPGNEKKPLSGGAGTQYPPYKAKLNVEQLTKQSRFPSNKPV